MQIAAKKQRKEKVMIDDVSLGSLLGLLDNNLTPGTNFDHIDVIVHLDGSN